MTVYPLLGSFLKQLAPSWRKTQLDNLARLSYALYHRRSLSLAELARAYPPPTEPRVKHPKHVLFHQRKRLRRFLDNPRLDFVSVFGYLLRLGNIVCQSPGLLLPILLDPTYFGKYTTVVAAIPRSGRALPVAVRAFRRNLEGEEDLSQNEIVQKLVQGIRQMLAEGIEAVIIADREFASAQFFRFLRSIKAGFAIRVDAETWIEHQDYRGPLGKLPIKPGGRRLWLTQARLGKQAREVVNTLAVWERGQKEPWFIATSLGEAQLTHRLYRKRMKIEHGFRDWKHHLKLEGTLKVESPERAQVLIRTLALLYWFLCLVGIKLNRPEYQARVSHWGKPSVFFLALQLFLMEVEAAMRAGKEVVRWVMDKLWPCYPLPPAYKLRYRRFR
ncbi:MAG: transposase [Chloroflexi bacterium]|nr:transposase [Chloroflexota bacterium]